MMGIAMGSWTLLHSRRARTTDNEDYEMLGDAGLWYARQVSFRVFI